MGSPDASRSPAMRPPPAGAHHVTAELFHALNDVGVRGRQQRHLLGREAMQSLDDDDAHPWPTETISTTARAATNVAHLATLPKTARYPR